METFRTHLSAQPAQLQFQYTDQLLCLGSCFAEHIGQRLISRKFKVNLNPFGILYNPISIRDNLHSLLHNYTYSDSDLFEHNGRWNSFAHHGRFSGFSKEKVLAAIQQEHQQAKNALHSINRLILTFGTAFVFEYKPNRRVVANCHKLPGHQFRRRRLSVPDIYQSWTPLLNDLKMMLPDLEVLLTLSPVRHLRDGLMENQRSKATLLLAMDELVQHFDFVHYFPAYELLLDDLRDYRFYNADMVHPSDIAIDYIWNFFQESYLTKETRQVAERIEKLQKALQHQPLFPESPDYARFLEQQLQRFTALQQEYAYLQFDAEIAGLKQQLGRLK